MVMMVNREAATTTTTRPRRRLAGYVKAGIPPPMEEMLLFVTKSVGEGFALVVPPLASLCGTGLHKVNKVVHDFDQIFQIIIHLALVFMNDIENAVL